MNRTRTLLALLLASLLTACGGGCYEGDADCDDTKSTTPVDCKARPELCK